MSEFTSKQVCMWRQEEGIRSSGDGIVVVSCLMQEQQVRFTIS